MVSSKLGSGVSYPIILLSVRDGSRLSMAMLLCASDACLHDVRNTLVGPDANDLTYMLAWESLADREKKWNAFFSDPVRVRWIKPLRG